MILYTECSVLHFIKSDDPVVVLGSHNAIVFKAKEGEDQEEIDLYFKHPSTTEEIKACLADLKVLNAKDFKLLLKWRAAMKEFDKAAEEEEEEEEPQEPEFALTEEQKDNLLQQEIEDKLRQKSRAKKKKV